jgi:hypothetical protein
VFVPTFLEILQKVPQFSIHLNKNQENNGITASKTLILVGKYSGFTCTYLDLTDGASIFHPVK